MIKLSICIATYNRAKFIAQTLDSILVQMEPSVEVIVVDGASEDGTRLIMEEYASRHPELRYFRENLNSGVDGDYDKAVGYAHGNYCWLMTDDDLLNPGALSRLLSILDGHRELIIVNAEVRTADFGGSLRSALVATQTNAEYAPEDADLLLTNTASALSFIGCVVVLRSFWLARDRASYYGSLFVHVGVIFQGRTPRTLVVADPLIAIRYGNAMWTPRGFEIWMFKWPALVWSFPSVSSAAKSRICAPEPWRQFRKLWLYRSIGGYAPDQYRRFLQERALGTLQRLLSRGIASVPARLANAISSVYCGLFARDARMNIYDLSRSQNASLVSRAVARSAGL